MTDLAASQPASIAATDARSPSDATDRQRPIAHKFGGSSLADATCMARVADILGESDPAGQVIVVSAMRGTTDALLALIDAALAEADWRAELDALRRRHRDTAEAIAAQTGNDVHATIEADFARLSEQLHAIALLGDASQDVRERIAGLGEVWSAHLLAARLSADGERVPVLDAREVLTVEAGELGPTVDWPRSADALADWRRRHPGPRWVVTGFVARRPDGRPTTLGRNGSDLSGAIFAILFDAAELIIWTDVEGVFSADPRLVPEAVPLPRLTYAEACELAYFGAKVIHPRTMAPAIAHGLPLSIRNTFLPDHPGTRIDAGDGRSEHPVSGLTLVAGMAILELTGSGLIGVPGTAQRVFAALHGVGASVVMISQGSSEHSICCVVRSRDAESGARALANAFASELAAGHVQGVSITPEISVLAAVGEGMAGTPGIAAKLFGALASARVNVRAIAQGASERNISAAIAASDATRALRAAHAAFWLSPQTVAVAVVGPGRVGQTLLAQLAAARERLLRDGNLDLRLLALADSRRMHLASRPIEPDRWREALAGADRASDGEALAQHLLDAHLPHALIIDCSASDRVAEHYPTWLARGIHVITPNKHAGSGPLDRHRAIRAASRSSGARFRYEATVGAGLPGIGTLRDLLDSGDVLHVVEGMFSGTLAWLFNRFDGSEAFSELVLQAQRLGYTEPDPREDLSGLDVARKLVILAREAGWPLSLDQVEIESLVPEALRSLDRDAALAALASMDADMAARLAEARATGRALRYVARLDRTGRAQVGLVALGPEHAFCHTRLTDNIVQFTTERYHDNPLVVQGPGAGPEVTAGGVFADLLRVAAHLGAPL